MFRFDWTLRPVWNADAQVLVAYARIGGITRQLRIDPAVLLAQGFGGSRQDGAAMVAFLEHAHEGIETAGATALLQSMAAGLELHNEVSWTMAGFRNVAGFAQLAEGPGPVS